MIANEVVGASVNCSIQLIMPWFRLLTYPDVFPDVTEFYCIRSTDSWRCLCVSPLPLVIHLNNTPPTFFSPLFLFLKEAFFSYQQKQLKGISLKSDKWLPHG